VKRIDLALQGGEAHGAFAWGVLHRLLTCKEPWIAGVVLSPEGTKKGR
jgi:NTE family protein